MEVNQKGQRTRGRASDLHWSVFTTITAGHGLLVNAIHSTLCNEIASSGYTFTFTWSTTTSRSNSQRTTGKE